MNLGRRGIAFALGFALGFALVLALVAAGCSQAHPAAESTTTTTSAPSGTGESVYANLGNFTVGVTTLRLPSGNLVEVWYPANGGVGVGSETYDVRSFLPAAVSRRLGAGVHAYVSTIANRDAPVGAAGERFPLVLFSHGYAGFRDVSTFLMTQLASWGMVVAAPDHPSRDLAHVLAPTTGQEPSDVADLLATIDLMQKENARAGGGFEGRIDMSKIAVVGYDVGGRAAMTVAADPRVAGYVALASDNRSPNGNGAPSSRGLPAKPSLFVAGANDRVVPAAGTAALFRNAPAPSYEWVLDGAGHNAFDDLCIVAQQQGGLIVLADRSGMGALFPTALRLAVTDGCGPPDLNVLKTWSVIDQVVTAFLRHVIGPDPAAVGVGPSGSRAVNGVGVTVAARLG